MAAFSRLQLAAALLEYDNDDSNPNAPRRSAQDSAIFSLMRRQARPEPAQRKSTNYLSVALPSDDPAEAPTERRSVNDSRRSRASTVNLMRNPFGPDEHDDESGGELDEVEGMEVDLASWGLDAFKAPEDKVAKPRKARERTQSEPMDRIDLQNPAPVAAAGARTRTRSLGNLDGFGLGGAFLEAQSTLPTGARPHSVASPLDLADLPPPPRPPHLRRQSEHSLIDNIAPAPPLHSVPFPQGDTSRPASRSSRLDLDERRMSIGSGSMLAYDQPQQRKSTGSLGSRMLANDVEEPNPFALPAPAQNRASRFDPKSQRERALSISSREMLGEHGELRSPGPLTVDDQSRQRTQSGVSMGSQRPLSQAMLTDQPRRRTYSKMDLMRPKVLIMPSPLQDAAAPPPPPEPRRDGFQLSTDGPPLPANARTTRRSSIVMSALVPSSSNSQIAGSQSGLSLSQMTFRNTLAVEGQNRMSTLGLPIATEDGQQIEFLDPPPPEPIAVVVDEAEQTPEVKRAAGKLYGRSLMDNLEARKAEMRSKTRAYRGNDRPAMMSRSTGPGPATLIDPATLQPQRPGSQRLDSFNSTGSAPALGRRQTLLNLDGVTGPSAPGVGKAQSVFGVDTLWEREMVKLRQMEAEEEGDRKVDEAQQDKKGKGKAMPSPISPAPSATGRALAGPPSPGPPLLPAVQRVTVRQAPRAEADDDDDASDDDESPIREEQPEIAGWESDDEDGRKPSAGRRPLAQPIRAPADDDSEEDLPLAATVGRAAERVAAFSKDDDSDEEKPLAALLPRVQLGVPAIDFDRPAATRGDDEEDDQPLAYRASSFMGSPSVNPLGTGVDDDVPLGMHPEHQRRTQYQMLAQAQQQQQMMMQAQMMHNSMMFGAPSVMGSGFMTPGMPPPMMMMPPPSMPSPPPAQDPAKFGRVDQWRRDVVG